MVHKFLNHQDIPWINMVWVSMGFLLSKLPIVPCGGETAWNFCHSTNLELIALFRMGNQFCYGKVTGMLWEECWPHLYSFAKDGNISTLDTTLVEDLSELFRLPLSEEAYSQFQEMEDLALICSYLTVKMFANFQLELWYRCVAYQILIGRIDPLRSRWTTNGLSTSFGEETT